MQFSYFYAHLLNSTLFVCLLACIFQINIDDLLTTNRSYHIRLILYLNCYGLFVAPVANSCTVVHYFPANRNHRSNAVILLEDPYGHANWSAVSWLWGYEQSHMARVAVKKTCRVQDKMSHRFFISLYCSL